MTATQEITDDASIEAQKKQIVTALLSYSYQGWSWGKALAVAQVPAVEKPIAFLEGKIVEKTSDVLRAAKVDPEIVVSTLDSKAFEVLEYYDVEARFSAVKTEAAKRLQKMKGEETDLEEEIKLRELIADATDLAWGQVEAVQNKASEKVDEVLSGAESYVDKVLPGEDEEQEEAAAAPETRIARISSISSTASRRFKRRAMKKLESATLKLRESTAEAPIVHLDLMRYSELLDIAAVRDRLVAVPDAIKSRAPESYAVVEDYVVKGALCVDALGKELNKYSGEIKQKAEDRVIVPAKEFYVVATAEFIKRVKSAEDLLKTGQEGIMARRMSAAEFTQKYVASVREALGTAWDERLVQPTEKFLANCRSVYENLHEKYEEGKASVSTTAPDGTPYTLEKGMEALVNALRQRLAVEWEMRVKPTIESLRGQTKPETE